MADVYCAIYGDLNYWDGTTEWGYDATSSKITPTAHVDQDARDAQYTAAYTSLSAWEAGRDGASQAGDTEHAIIQTPWDADDTTAVNLSTWPACGIAIKAIGDARHSGVWDDGADSPHRLVVAAATVVLQISDADITSLFYDGLQVHNTEQIDTTNEAIAVAQSTTATISNCILVTDNASGLRINGATAVVDIYNTVIYNSGAGGSTDEGLFFQSVGTGQCYNNTIYGFNDGIEVDAVTTSVAIKNTAVFNNATDLDDAVGVTLDYNASDAAFGNNPQDLNENVGGEWTAAFTNYAGFDFSVKDASSLLYNNGVADLFADDDDIIGTSRPQSTSWDIGAFELIVAVGGSPGAILLMDHFNGGFLNG